MLSKKEFCEIIEQLRNNEEYISELNQIFRKHKKDTQVFATGLENTVVKLLESIFNDFNNWIAWWCWELDFGKHYKDGCISSEDGKVISIKTPSELYDLLIDNQNNINKTPRHIKSLLTDSGAYIMSSIEGKGCHIGRIKDVGLDSDGNMVIDIDIDRVSCTS